MGRVGLALEFFGLRAPGRRRIAVRGGVGAGAVSASGGPRRRVVASRRSARCERILATHRSVARLRLVLVLVLAARPTVCGRVAAASRLTGRERVLAPCRGVGGERVLVPARPGRSAGRVVSAALVVPRRRPAPRCFSRRRALAIAERPAFRRGAASARFGARVRRRRPAVAAFARVTIATSRTILVRPA
ncbi:hypothetical protein [Piscinibacter koreensis]|uniref:hypothetical protein n=1 Tax=Piscinibacter koreensis TaxID=2742824 RepID=UPI001FE3A614|nr:hypothetical protein [Schlegelella koreensis]